MYWYFKYPFLLLLFVTAFGLCYLGWRKLPDSAWLKRPFGGGGETAEVSDGSDELVGSESSRRTRVRDRRVALEHDQLLAAAQDQLKEANLDAARTLARKVLNGRGVTPYSDIWVRSADTISAANSALFNCDAPVPEKAAYIVETGDSLVKIAYANATTVGALQRLNGLDPTDPIIHPSEVLFYYDCEWSIVVSKQHFALLLMADDKLFKYYRVAIGRQNRTPVGSFEVSDKVLHPPWKSIPYGDPRNVLGTHWLALTATEDTNKSLKGYGIHGTWEPDSIGTAASEGCIRMRNEDVEELFDLVPLRVKTVIKDG